LRPGVPRSPEAQGQLCAFGKCSPTEQFRNLVVGRLSLRERFRRVGSENAPPALEAASDIDPTTREKTLSHLVDALEKASGETVEQHPTGFGTIIVARLKGPDYLAFAIGTAWPMPVLDIHRMNRTSGTTQPLRKPAGLVAADTPGIVRTFHFVRDSQGGSNDVVD
jgi:hypothetical protein